MKTNIIVGIIFATMWFIIANLWNEYRQSKIDAILQRVKKLENNVMRPRVIEKSSITKKDIEEIIRKYVVQKNVKRVVNVGFSSGGNWNSRKNEEDKLTKRYKTKKKTIYWNVGKELMPIAIAFYSPNKDAAGKEPWLVKTFRMKYKVQVVEEDNNGKPRYTAIVKVRPQNIHGWENRWATIPIDEKNTSITVKRERNKGLRFWNPKVALVVDYDTAMQEFYPSISFNVVNYGESENPEFKFFSPFIGIANKKMIYGLSLFEWHPDFGILHDTYIGLGINNNKNFLLEISTNL